MHNYNSQKSPISHFLDHQGFFILDGGLGSELENRGHNLNNKLWSASVLLDHSNTIYDIALSYLEAGADCIVTSTYQASIPSLLEAGLSKEEAKSLIQKAVQIAIEARNQYLNNNKDKSRLRPLIAASIGPYGAYLADGSEYNGNYKLSATELRSFHEARWEILVDSPVDLFAFETIPSFREAQVLLDILKSTPNTFAWISFSCIDGMRISDGTLLSDCVKIFNNCDQIVGVGVNCIAPQYAASLINQVRKGAPDKPIIVYPNAGETYDANKKCWIGSSHPTSLSTASIEWFNLGAQILGGCCRTGPDQIKELRKTLFKLKSPKRI